MARVRPLAAIRYDTAVVSLGSALAPPYDVISEPLREELYARDLRNIVRVDYCRDEPGDVPGERDRYTRARDHLEAWLRLGVVRRDEREAVYVSEHTFPLPRGGTATRRGVFALVPALPWDRGDMRPHEHTMRGPKEDRLRLMRATRTQTSAVFGLWSGAAGVDPILDRAVARRPDAEGGCAGELGDEQHRLWVVDDPGEVVALGEAFAPATLYVADGHHRYETAVAFFEQEGIEDGTVLVYLADAADGGIEIEATHRLVLPREGAPATLDELAARLEPDQRLEPCDEAAAGRLMAAARDGDHAFAVVAADGAAVLRWPRREESSPRRRLDVVQLQERVLATACGLDEEALRSGAVAYTRDLGGMLRRVRDGEAVLGFGCNPCSTAELLAVADAGEVMPQKSTYFFPKVPTGLVLHPLDV